MRNLRSIASAGTTGAPPCRHGSRGRRRAGRRALRAAPGRRRPRRRPRGAGGAARRCRTTIRRAPEAPARTPARSPGRAPLPPSVPGRREGRCRRSAARPSRRRPAAAGATGVPGRTSSQRTCWPSAWVACRKKGAKPPGPPMVASHPRTRSGCMNGVACAVGSSEAARQPARCRGSQTSSQVRSQSKRHAIAALWTRRLRLSRPPSRHRKGALEVDAVAAAVDDQEVLGSRRSASARRARGCAGSSRPGRAGEEGVRLARAGRRRRGRRPPGTAAATAG